MAGRSHMMEKDAATPAFENARPPSRTINKSNTRTNTNTNTNTKRYMMTSALLAVLAALAIRQFVPSDTVGVGVQGVSAWNDGSWMQNIPSAAQYLDPGSFAVIGNVPSPAVRNGSNLFVPPNTTLSSLSARPFHIYDPSFLSIIGPDPHLTLIASSASGDPLFHEAVTWYPPTDEVFFVQNAGAKAAGTGLKKSAVVEKIALSQVASALSGLKGQGKGQGEGLGQRNVSGQVDVVVVNGTMPVINPNGGTNFQDGILFVGEGQGDSIAPAIYKVIPYPPYETTVLLDNYWGIQYNSLNDIAVNPRNKDLYFTDPLYGYFQDFRPSPGLPNQVYRFDWRTGVVTVVADGFDQPNGLTFSPDGKTVYIVDSGAGHGFFGSNYTRPSTIYSYTVLSSGQFTSRTLFAHSPVGLPDGIHCDSIGNVYAGTGDGVRVWSPEGRPLGNIYLGTTSANFQFAGKGRMIICAETQLWYVQLGAEGAGVTDYDYSEVLP